MQKRKFDELILHFNRKVSEMSIDQKYKMELLGMVSAIGFAHEKEHGTNLAEVGTDCISREQAIVTAVNAAINWHKLANPQYSIAYCIGEAVRQLPPIQPKRGKWIDKGITGDWQYQIDGRGRSWHEWQCDQCKDMVKKRSFYCPNCGADMREKGENSESN